MTNHDAHPAPVPPQKETTMKTTTMTKLGGLAALAAAGLALTGCSATGGETETQPEHEAQPAVPADVQQAQPLALPDEASYVRASPEEMHTLSVDGDQVKVTRAYCDPKGDGSVRPTLTPLETAVGEIGEDSTITWYDGGAYTDEDEMAVETRSDGDVLLVGGKAFYSLHSGVVETDSYLHGWDVSQAWTLSACVDGGGEA